MAITNPISITYGDRTIGGGSSTYQLLGPYTIDKSFDSIRVVAEVIVTASSIGGLQSASEALEDDFRKRLRDGDSFVITMSGSSWTYSVGQDVLKVRASIAKSGNPETDRGYSRAYTVTIEGELPADGTGDNGLRDIEAMVAFDAARRKTVTVRGVFTAGTGGDALATYQSNGDDRVQEYLDAIDSNAVWELVDESYSLDREGPPGTPAPHLLAFSRQYVEILAAQSAAGLDDPQIQDHRITFTDLGQYPGDAREDITRLRRVIANFDCAVNAEETKALSTVYRSKIRDFIREQFVATFAPSQFGVEEERVSYDTTANRISAAFQFIYQPEGGENIIEIEQSLAYREARQIDYTPSHDEDEFAADADIGFATLERVWTRTAIALGTEAPKRRIERRAGAGAVGRFTDTIGGETGPDNRDTSKVVRDGWNVIANTSQVTPKFLGNTADDRKIEVTILNETVIERFNRKPGNRTSVPIPGGGGTTG